MIKQIRTSKLSKVVACYLVLMIFLELTQPMVMFALTEGPTQPEFNSFTPIGTSDMVDLASGDFNYNIPIMDVGGYPINLAYNSGVTMDQEASWVGLGWNLNIGQINRNVRGLPDDFKGDGIINENNLKKNITVGVNPYINGSVVGLGDHLSAGAGLNVEYNNYYGITATPSFGVSFKISDNVTVGMQLSSSNTQGTTVTPSVKLSATSEKTKAGQSFGFSLSPSLSYNSRQGLTSFNLSSGISYQNGYYNKIGCGQKSQGLASGSGSISFVNNTFTPSKRLAFKNQSVTFSFSGGPDFFGADVEGSITAYGSVQSLRDKVKTDKAYGYENTEFSTDSDLLDFNREKESATVTKNTTILPVTNYTYDLLAIQGQGISGQIRPFRGQVGYVHDPKVNDISSSVSIGLEIEGGAGGHIGGNLKYTDSRTYTGPWNTVATNFFKESTVGTAIDYEKAYYKNIGENRIDQEFSSLFKNKLSSYNAITLQLDGNKNASNRYLKKIQPSNVSALVPVTAAGGTTPVTISNLKRIHREKRNQVVQKITKSEVAKYNLASLFKVNNNAKDWHNAGYIVTDENGTRNVFGTTAYNTTKQEVAFATRRAPNADEKKNGLFTYASGENTSGNSAGIDHYFNRITTPAYAHTYLLSSLLSTDYVDLTSNGPTEDDLGSYTKFNYSTFNNYKWRIPFGKLKNGQIVENASFNEGLKNHVNDQKGSYLYGEKELKYVTSIVTKTHVAFIDLTNREDGIGTAGQNGGPGAGRMKKITSIRLYAKPEIQFDSNNNPINPNSSVIPIKTAHFDYNYTLCPNIDNNSGADLVVDGVHINTNKGKLTLTKVYFTYGNSNLGKYTAYKFHYDDTANPAEGTFNPSYNAKNYDIWGNYMPNKAFPITGGEILAENTPQEFPYVNQNNEDEQNTFASSWSLSSIDLPSGGKIKLSYESDDYQYVQDKKAMQMFKVAGVSTGINEPITESLNNSKYVVVEINQEDINLPEETIRQKYIGEQAGKPIYFNFFINLVENKKDYVPGYFEVDGEASCPPASGHRYLYIPMKKLNREGKIGGADNENPISVAGWFFGRKHLPYQVFGESGDAGTTSIPGIAWSILSSLGSFVELLTGPNGRLKDFFGCALHFDKNKSWVRLQEPSGTKRGGGARIKKIEMFDSWEKMMDVNDSSAEIQRYKKKYGQEYNYDLENGTSSGVATYEPNLCKENPLIQPFYNGREKMAAATYEEKPFGESFFPSPTVTYSKVTVKNITAADDDEGDTEIRKTRSGTVITEHYTSKDFPTKADFTTLDNPLVNYYETNENEMVKNMLKSMLGLKITVKTRLVMSQGFVIETNDMNGKVKKQTVLNNAGAIVSSVENIYSTEATDNSTLKSDLPVINKDGSVSTNHALGLHYDVINDFRESYAYTNVYGVSANFNVIPLFFIPLCIFTALPDRSEHTTILRTAVTTKVIHKTGILKEKIAYDLGSRVSTKNLAWDANTGQVLLTQTANEYDDDYYSLNFPAYWYYDRMGMSSQNVDIEGKLTYNNASPSYFGIKGLVSGAPVINNVTPYLRIGDELVFDSGPAHTKLWVYEYKPDFSKVKLMRSDGSIINSSYYYSVLLNKKFRIFRSGNRNQQMGSMATVTLMKNPLISNGTTTNVSMDLLRYNYTTDPATIDTVSDDPKIINASAVEYSEDWLSQCENGLPSPLGLINGTGTPVNPFFYNIKGQWRAVKSYAYLTGRNAATNADTRKAGFYKKFNPFYKNQNVAAGTWAIDNANWTFASQVTKFSPYGTELENKDAINRYSSAQYGYNYKLPIAVSSNAKYNEMGFDGFEDYNFNFWQVPSPLRPHFGFQQNVNPNAAVTNKKSHTGKNSIVVKSEQRATLVKKINGCKPNNNNNNGSNVN